MKYIVLIYNILLVSLLLASGLVAGGGATRTIGLMFVPVLIYFLRQLVSRNPQPIFGYAQRQPRAAAPATRPKLASTSPTKAQVATSKPSPQPSGLLTTLARSFAQSTATPTMPKPTSTLGDVVASMDAIDGEVMDDAQVRDINRRLFLKLIGSAGLATFVLSLFTKQAQGAFFGSMPVPGLVGVKDSNGTQIDPAKNHPTDGYEVNDVDDSSVPAYYGFVDKDNNWYITKEDSDGSFRYVKGTGSYVAAWTNRASQAYGYFSNVF